jgi:hypothetical protein
MKYNAPFGSADPNAAYVDRNTPGAVSGSRVPALALEAPQREIAAVIAAAGIEPSNGDFTQLLQAIGNLISAATGGGGDENYVLMTEARTRLPIFPEVLTIDGRLPIASPVPGSVRVPAGYSFLHRGVFNVTTVQADFATSANRTYHLRWNKTDGFALRDLADVAYNAGAVAETSPIFDSSFDDMLVAKVVTDGANAPTITTLANKARMTLDVTLSGNATIMSTGVAGANDGASYTNSTAVNWARTPLAVVDGMVRQGTSPLVNGYANRIDSKNINRYAIGATIVTDWDRSLVTAGATPVGEIYIQGIAA